MSTDEARNMLTVAKRLRDKYQGMLPTAQSLTQLTSPADEPGSNGYNKLLVDAGPPPGAFAAGESQVKQEYAYADELVKRLEQALGITETSDEQAGTDVKNATSGNESKGFAG
ncbi:hypothetical protein [Amycolatopsis ultiminotia]